MSFLFPLYFLGALALAAPLLLHLRKRPPKDQTLFSSLMFLDKTPEKMTRRSKLEKLLLLALRCLALLLLALMFARPFVADRPFAAGLSEGRRVVFLIDRSASMQRADLWSQAKQGLRQDLEALQAMDEAALIVFDQKDSRLMAFDEWKQVAPPERVEFAMGRLKEVEPGWRSTDLAEPLTSALELMADGDAVDAVSGKRFGVREVVLISDFQQGSEREALNRLSWPEGVRLRNVVVKTEGTSNFSLFAASRQGEGDASLPAEGEGSKKREADQMVRVRIANSQEGEAEKFTLAWVSQGGTEAGRVEGNVPSGGARVLMAPPRMNESAAGVLEVVGDEHPFDNRIYIGPTQARVVKILYLGEDPGKVDAGAPLFYLSRALRKTLQVEPLLETRRLGDVKTVDELMGFDVVILTGVWNEQLGGNLADFVRQSGAVVICAVAEGIGNEGLQALMGLDGVGVSEAVVNDYAMLAGLDFEHPVMQSFAKAGVRDFSKIHFWKHRVLTLPDSNKNSARVSLMADFDDGSPAWVDVKQGQGRVYLMLSGWEPEESQLALSSKFVPLLYSILNEAGFSAVKAPPLYVGVALPVAGAKSVKKPDSAEWIAVEAGQQLFSATDRPGFYTVLSEDGKGGQASRVYAMNLAPSESRVDAFEAQSLADFGIVVQDTSGGFRAASEQAKEGGQEYRLDMEEREGRQKAWKWIVLAVLLVLWLESWVAGSVGRKAVVV